VIQHLIALTTLLLFIEMKQIVTLFFLLGVFFSRSTTPGKLYLN